jgi:hypothetical protein
MMIIGMLIGYLVIGNSGCIPNLLNIAVKTLSIVQDAVMIVDQIASFVDVYFKEHPNPDTEKTVRMVINDCRGYLVILQRCSAAGKNMISKDYDLALENFNAAFLQLISLLQPYGVQMDGYAGTYAGVPRLKVARPLSLGPRPNPIALEAF